MYSNPVFAATDRDASGNPIPSGTSAFEVLATHPFAEEGTVTANVMINDDGGSSDARSVRPLRGATRDGRRPARVDLQRPAAADGAFAAPRRMRPRLRRGGRLSGRVGGVVQHPGRAPQSRARPRVRIPRCRHGGWGLGSTA